MILVIDTDVMFAAFDSPHGASRRLLDRVLDGQTVMAVSVPLMLEYEAVLTRPQNLARFGLRHDEVMEALDDLVSMILPVGIDVSWRPVANDPDDDHLIETAINGGVSLIASLKLSDLRTPAARFGITVARPADILRSL
jgi:putative PIN family toxin of toxin-antitoxin system